VRPPRQDRIGRGIGFEEHVRLLDAGETLYRGSVEPDAVRQCLLGLLDRYGDVLGLSLDVGELEPQEFHQVGFYPLEHLADHVSCHMEISFYPTLYISIHPIFTATAGSGVSPPWHMTAVQTE